MTNRRKFQKHLSKSSSLVTEGKRLGFFDGTGFGVKFRKYFSFDFLGPLDGDKLHVPNLGLNSSLPVNLIKY